MTNNPAQSEFPTSNSFCQTLLNKILSKTRLPIKKAAETKTFMEEVEKDGTMQSLAKIDELGQRNQIYPMQELPVNFKLNSDISNDVSRQQVKKVPKLNDQSKELAGF